MKLLFFKMASKTFICTDVSQKFTKNLNLSKNSFIIYFVKLSQFWPLYFKLPGFSKKKITPMKLK